MKKNQTSKASKTTAKVSTKKGAPTPTKKDGKPAPKPAVEAANVAPETPATPPPVPHATETPTPTADAPTAQPAAKKDKPEARDGSKKATVLALLRREGGATLGEIAHATDWQLHSIRGFLSTLGKKTGLKVESIKGEGDAKRRYHIA
jgi:hypothetical protein